MAAINADTDAVTTFPPGIQFTIGTAPCIGTKAGDAIMASGWNVSSIGPMYSASFASTVKDITQLIPEIKCSAISATHEVTTAIFCTIRHTTYPASVETSKVTSSIARSNKVPAPILQAEFLCVSFIGICCVHAVAAVGAAGTYFSWNHSSSSGVTQCVVCRPSMVMNAPSLNLFFALSSGVKDI